MGLKSELKKEGIIYFSFKKKTVILAQKVSKLKKTLKILSLIEAKNNDV